MINNLKNIPKYAQYIFVFLFSFITMLVFSSINAYAAAPQKIKISDVSGMSGWEIKSNTCNQWKKSGSGCSVTISTKGSGYGECPLSASLTFKFINNGSKFEAGSYKPTGATGSSYCRYNATVTIYNYDTILPHRTGDVSITPIGGTVCSTNTVGNNGSITCTGPINATGRFTDGESGIANGGTFTKRCEVGDYCIIRGMDKVGNESSSSVSDYYQQRPYIFMIKADTQKCSRTTGGIYSGTSYNGWYVGTAKCSARCTADNLAVGGTGYGSTTGENCYAQACDKAGNCKSVLTKVPRDYNPPTCAQQNISSDGLIGPYRMGNVTVSWKCTDSQSGCKQGTYSQSTLNNHLTSLGQTVYDKTGNSKPCPAWSWTRDTRAPSGCNYTLSDFSNSSITTTAWCTSDGESGCSPDRKYRTYYDNGSYTGGNGIAVYDMTEKYRATPTNYMNCPITVNKIDRVAPTCAATTTVANPTLSANGKTWSTNTWHNNADVIYDENGNAVANSKKRVQGYLNSTYDNASSGGNASGIKSGFTGGTALGSLNQEARTEYNDGSQNGLYTIFSRDKIVDNVTNNLRGWSGSTLYAHGVTTSGNVGTCQVPVYSFDNNKPVAHVQLEDRQIDGDYSIWNNTGASQNVSTKKVNNNQNSVNFWSSVDITVKYWGSDPNGTSVYDNFNGNQYNGRSGVKRICSRYKNNDINGGAYTTWNCKNVADQRNGSDTNTDTNNVITINANNYPGTTTVYVKVQDWAGNWSNEATQNVYIDKSTPKTIDDSATSKQGFTETVNGENYNNMTNVLYSSDKLDRPWSNTEIASVFKGTDNERHQAAGSYQFGYFWAIDELTQTEINNLNWYYYNNSDKYAGITAGTKAFNLPAITNPMRTDYYYLYVRLCDNVQIGPRNCSIHKSKLVRYDNDKPRIDDILDITQGESDINANSVTNGHKWTNKLKVKVTTHDEPNSGKRAQVAYIKFKWNTNVNTDTTDKSQAVFDKIENAYTNDSTLAVEQKEDGWTYVQCSNSDADANYCAAIIDFNKFVKSSLPVNEGWRFLKIAIVDKAGNVSGDNGIVYGPFEFDITPPKITGLEFRGHRADNGAEITY